MFRFTIRDLLWLMVAVGLACGWWVSVAQTRAEWRSERDQIFVEWRKDKARWEALLYRINTALPKLPTAERQELLRTVFGRTEPADKQGPAKLNRP